MVLRKGMLSGLVVLSLSSVLSSCDQTTSTVPETASPRRVSASGMTSADSVAFVAEFPGGSPALATVTTISLEAGDSILVSVQSTDCSGNPETVNVYGVISGVVVSGSCLTLPGPTGAARACRSRRYCFVPRHAPILWSRPFRASVRLLPILHCRNE